MPFSSKTFWGKALEVGAAVTAAPIAIAKAGGNISKANEYFGEMIEGAGKFGDKHAEHIEKTTITGAFLVAGAVTKQKLIDKK